MGGGEDCIYMMFVCMVVWGDDMSHWSGLGWCGVMSLVLVLVPSDFGIAEQCQGGGSCSGHHLCTNGGHAPSGG